MSSAESFSSARWREPPDPVRVLMVCGWLTSVEANDPKLRIETLSSSHSVFRVVAPDGRSVVVKQLARKAWESGRSLVRELYVYRLAGWVMELSTILPKALLIDERYQTLVVEWIEKCHPASACEVDLELISPGVSANLGRTIATWHRATAGISAPPALSNGVLYLPDLGETASDGRSHAAKQFMRVVLDDPELCGALRDGQSLYQYKCLVHGDIRSDSWFVQTHSPYPHVKIVDWDLSGAGDPAWDVGSVCAESILAGLRIGMTLQKRASGWPIALEPTLKELVAAYIGTGGLLATDDRSDWERVVLYTVGRLLHVGTEWAEAIDTDSGSMMNILEEARALLRWRDSAAASLVQWATDQQTGFL